MKIPHLLSSFTAGVMALAVAALALFPVIRSEARVEPFDPIHKIIQQRARRSRAKIVSARRDYYQALGIYHELFQSGREDLVKPDRNDPESVLYYLNGLYEEVTSAVTASSSSASSFSGDALVDREKELLRFYLRTRYCPESFGATSQGFYELCRQLLGRTQRTQAPVGLMNQYQKRNIDRLERNQSSSAR